MVGWPSEVLMILRARQPSTPWEDFLHWLRLWLGPRIGKYSKEGTSNTIPGHNLPLASVGAFILWFGWFGFNPGSSLGAVGNWELIGAVVVNTFLASAAGGIATMFYTYFSYGKIDITMVINGI